MSYHVTHSSGATDVLFPPDRLEELLDELPAADAEHGDVSVTHESEWSLTVSRSGVLILENLDGGDPMHARPVSRAETLEIMRAVAEGRIADALAKPWTPGYPR